MKFHINLGSESFSNTLKMAMHIYNKVIFDKKKYLKDLSLVIIMSDSNKVIFNKKIFII